jgi:predicted SprT family Zn-dependent metalloprotease
MDISANAFNLQKRIDYALANFRKNAPELASQMSWHFTDVVVSKRLRRAAGRCSYWRATDEMRIEFSANLFENIPEMEKTDTVIHELAHGVCFRLKLDRGHGYEFKRICKLMGGSGDRCLKVEDGVVKRNLVKRWVLVRESDPSKLFIRTKKQADNLTVIYRDAVLLGVIQVDQNEKKVKWLKVRNGAVLNINPLDEKKWKLVA